MQNMNKLLLCLKMASLACAIAPIECSLLESV